MIKEEIKKININNAIYDYKMDYKEELKPIYDTAKSFYKKTMIYNNYTKNINALKSYDTMIASKVYLNNNYYLIFNNYYRNSATTQRHIKEYLKQYIIDYKLNDINITNDDIYYISKINLIDDINNYFIIKDNINNKKSAIKHFKELLKEEEKNTYNIDYNKLIDTLKEELKASKEKLKELLNNYNI